VANRERSLPNNVPGRFFVDDSCINCDNCRDVAPTVFGEAALRAFVAKQPDSSEEEELAELALVQCPKGSIGVAQPGQLAPLKLFQRFPELIESDVYWLGYNSPKAFGSKSYFIKHPDGNWMIDGPKFHPTLVKEIEERGGLKYIFLTHRDDVGDADLFAKHFGAQRIMHEQDTCTQPGCEIVLDTFEPTSFGSDFVIIGTPGHTEGHCMLIYKNKFLFSGDTLTSHVRFNEPLEAWSPLYCWFDFDVLAKSLERLAEYDFEWLLPGHGRRHKLESGTARQSMLQAVKRCLEEPDKDPIAYHRAELFEAVSHFVVDPTQQKRYREKAMRNREALKQLSGGT